MEGTIDFRKDGRPDEVARKVSWPDGAYGSMLEVVAELRLQGIIEAEEMGDPACSHPLNASELERLAPSLGLEVSRSRFLEIKQHLMGTQVDIGVRNTPSGPIFTRGTDDRLPTLLDKELFGEAQAQRQRQQVEALSRLVPGQEPKEGVFDQRFALARNALDSDGSVSAAVLSVTDYGRFLQRQDAWADHWEALAAGASREELDKLLQAQSLADEAPVPEEYVERASLEQSYAAVPAATEEPSTQVRPGMDPAHIVSAAEALAHLTSRGNSLPPFSSTPTQEPVREWVPTQRKTTF